MLKGRASLILFIVLSLCILSIPLALAQNDPPIADAGPDQDIYVDEFTTLEGSASDPNGHDIVEWLWTVESAPTGSSPYLSDPMRPDPLFQADIAGDYVLSLIASDGMDWSDPDTVTISAHEILPPVAIATANVTGGPAPLTVQFNGSQSYARYPWQGGGTLLYDWNFGDSSPTSSEVSPTHVYRFSGTYLVRLNVLDSIGQGDDDTLTIGVYDPSMPPWDITGPSLWVPDGKCDSRDLELTVQLYRSVYGDGRYDSRADITGPYYLFRDYKIDVRDVALVALHYGETY